MPLSVHLFDVNLVGTVISIHHDKTLETMAPITARLTSSGGVLRSTPDASLLVQSLLDLGAWVPRRLHALAESDFCHLLYQWSMRRYVS